MKNLSIEERVEIVINQCHETIKCKEKDMILAEKKDDNTKWLHHHEMKELCQTIIDMLQGDYDLTV